MEKPERISVAVVLLYATSVLGIIEPLMSGSILGHYTPLIYVDFIAYVTLALVAYLISRGSRLAKVLYILLAIAWYAILIGILPWKYGHSLNTVSVFGQLCLTIVALVLLFQKKSLKWFRERREV